MRCIGGCIGSGSAKALSLGSERIHMRNIALAGLGIVALACAAPSSADPTPGHDAKVTTQTPPMLCEIGSA